MVGLVVGIIRFVLEFVYALPACDEPDTRPDLVKNFHYLYFAIFLFLLTGVVAIVVSLITPPIDPKHVGITSLTMYQERYDEFAINVH